MLCVHYLFIFLLASSNQDQLRLMYQQLAMNNPFLNNSGAMFPLQVLCYLIICYWKFQRSSVHSIQLNAWKYFVTFLQFLVVLSFTETNALVCLSTT